MFVLAGSSSEAEKNVQDILTKLEVDSIDMGSIGEIIELTDGTVYEISDDSIVEFDS